MLNVSVYAGRVAAAQPEELAAFAERVLAAAPVDFPLRCCACIHVQVQEATNKADGSARP